MNTNEKYIDENIADLCKEYDIIHGMNINISRITSDLIDGLKPVQRRALFTMFLKDQGKTFRKVATIAGDTFGRIHPHSPVAIESAIVGIAQEWNNNIPLIEGSGNFGCHDDQTEVMTLEGWKLFENITKDDLLATINPENGLMIFEHPTHIYKYPFNGDMVCGYTENLDFMVTFTHKMLYKNENGKYVLEPIAGIPEHIELLSEFTCTNSKLIDTMKNNSNMDSSRIFPYILYPNDVYKFKITSATHINRDSDLKVVKYDGYVYCAEVPSYHTLVTRRNGKVLVSGNSVSGDPAGASRYIKARLSKYAYACFFEDWKDAVVDMVMGYDEETKEPLYLPAKYPNVLLNGTLGIGYGASSNIPCYNFKEVVEACIVLMCDPKAKIILIPDSPTGADIIETDFGKLTERGNGVYSMRCTYEIDDKNNEIIITSLPYQVTVNTIRERIADIKEKGGMPELVSMNDFSGHKVDLHLIIRNDINPYKFMRKLIKDVGGLEKSYPVNITVTNDFEIFDYSIRELLLEWIRYRREQKRVVLTHKRTTLLAEQRTNDVKIFLMNKNNLNDTIKIFRTSRNKSEIEKRLIEKYHHSEIKMDSLQAKVLSNLRMHELSIESYEACLKRREELINELNDVEEILNTRNGVDKVIIGELRDGIKRFGSPRHSNVIPYKISTHSEIDGFCTLQLSADGNILRIPSSNVEEEPIPTDSNGFAVKVDNDSAFIVIDEYGYYSIIKASEVPLNTEVPLNRFLKISLQGNIIAMLPADLDADLCCTLISKDGLMKRMKIREMVPSKRPCIALSENDKLIRGLVTKVNSNKDILIYTKNGYGQRLDPNNIRLTSPYAKGIMGFKLSNNDEIIGCYTINPQENQYILYITSRGRVRLNQINYLPTRDSKHDAMVKLITLNDRDKLVRVIGCNKYDQVKVYFDDKDSEIIDISKLKESTMSSEPKKVTKKNAVSTLIVTAVLM